MLDELVAELSKLYGESESIRRVIYNAGIPGTYIEFGGAITGVWRGIIREADNRGKVSDLIRVVLRKYPQNHRLREIWTQIVYGAADSDPRELLRMGISVLMVAPRSSLPMVDAEVQDVLRSGLEVTPIFSPISQVTLTREIRSSEATGLWLAGHMDATGNFQLDNGELLAASALTSLVRGRFEWVYLNTCQSIGAAQMLQNETDADIIATIVEVPDQVASRTGSLFARALAESGDTRRAYEQSKPGGNRIYLYLAAASNRFLALVIP